MGGHYDGRSKPKDVLTSGEMLKDYQGEKLKIGSSCFRLVEFGTSLPNGVGGRTFLPSGAPVDPGPVPGL